MTQCLGQFEYIASRRGLSVTCGGLPGLGQTGPHAWSTAAPVTSGLRPCRAQPCHHQCTSQCGVLFAGGRGPGAGGRHESPRRM